MRHHNSQARRQDGQTLIETIIAIFILTTTLVSAVGLSIYVLSNSEINENELIGTNLAREGIEVVRYMRDTNWLESDAKNGNGYELQNCTIGSSQFQCYPKAWNGVGGGNYHNFDITGGGNGAAKAYRATFNTATNEWTLDTSNNYNLYLQNAGFYTTNANGTSNYSRKIIISENGNLPYDSHDSLSQLIIKSIVAWRNKRCQWAGQDPETAPVSCQVIVEDRLTNWKDYK